MNETLNRFMLFMKALPPTKKISIAFIFCLLMAGFGTLFFLANDVDYQVLYNNLSQKDAGAIVAELKKSNIPYRIEGNGAVILVPAERVHDVRLSLVAEGLPKEGNVGFEIFDKTDFKTTRFVQELNYQRALQGELARTISRFKEVADAKVFIVLPKETLFVEASKPASASIQLDLKNSLSPNKLSAIIHLVASAVQGLEPERVTVVDTRGRVIFKGGNQNDGTGLLSGMQLDYKAKVESDIRANVQSMLEGIVGSGKAIVRVNAEIDFNKITLSEEEYDPSSSVVRSKRDIEESSQDASTHTAAAQTVINQRAGVVPAANSPFSGKKKKDIVTNFEINKVTRAIVKPAGEIKRLSVAAVIDGTYETETLADGKTGRKYTPRTEQEIRKFETIVKSAMGYSEDREDQVSVSSIPFSDSLPLDARTEKAPDGIDYLQLLKDSKKPLINLALMLVVFFVLIRPLLKNLKKITGEPLFENAEPAKVGARVPQIAAAPAIGQKERIFEISKNNPERTEQLIKGWISE